MAKQYYYGDDNTLNYSSTLLDGSATTPATASWSEVQIVRDETHDDQASEIDISSRESDVDLGAPGRRKISIDVDLIYRPGDTGFDAIETAYQTRDPVALAMMNGAIATAGNKGKAANWSVLKMSTPKPLRDVLVTSITLVPYSQYEDYTAA